MGSPEPSAPSDKAIREETIAWLSRLRSSATQAEMVKFEEWYSADARHADIYDAVLRTWELSHAAGRTSAFKDYAERKTRSPSAFRLFAIAAIIACLMVSIGFVALRAARLADPENAPPTQLASAIGEIRTISLPDGSVVTLDTDSAVAVAYSGTNRRLTLIRGRARFDVAHDKARPFIVGAGANEVIAHGTKFDVDLHGPRPVVSLLQGAIEVRDRGRPERRQFLRAGEQTVIASDTTPQTPTALAETDKRWTSGMLSFTNAPMSQVAAETNRYATQRIVFANAATAALRFTGTFKANDSAGLAALLADSFHLSVSRGPGGIFILKAKKP